jgi:ketosteroid isomerase-like protein
MRLSRPPVQRPLSTSGGRDAGMTVVMLTRVVAAIAILAPALAWSSQLAVKSDQEILIQLEQDWVAALQRNDVKFVDSVLAEEFVSTYGDGSRGDRKRELQLVAEFNQHVDEWSVGEFMVKVYRDTAVVWFTQRMVGPVQGKPTEILTRYTDVFVNRDGKWLCVASQSTKVTQK